MLFQSRKGIRFDLANRLAGLTNTAIEEIEDQFDQVFPSLAKCGQSDADYVETVIEVFTEFCWASLFRRP